MITSSTHHLVIISLKRALKKGYSRFLEKLIERKKGFGHFKNVQFSYPGQAIFFSVQYQYTYTMEGVGKKPPTNSTYIIFNG